ncbi:MAG TPA: tRNA lysidine(34) synthetase TilS, partial [Tepidisphaeraceae bacterium]|nr:tRNA lysidine(34) synthetase TilS [Tepidisphaeraceae bacterium]
MPEVPTRLSAAIAAVPAGRWAVAVSGGADSVALLMLLARDARASERMLHIVHLDHQARAGASGEDAAFVENLATRFHLPCTIARRSEIEAGMVDLPNNTAARYRAVRMRLFRDVIESHQLQGVIVAHHGDDQAETVLHRLLRGSPPTALAAMSVDAVINGVRVLRPLLAVPHVDLQRYLEGIGETWREDASNASPRYLRNRIRPILAKDSALRGSAIRLGSACSALKAWLNHVMPGLDDRFDAAKLGSLPPPLARAAASRWLAHHAVPVEEISQVVCDRLIAMATDAASPARQHFPGGVQVHRRRG